MMFSFLRDKAPQYLQIFTHFEQPLRTLLMRLGLPHAERASFRIHKAGKHYTMTGRPRRGDIWLLREVLVEETYRSLLPFLPEGPLRYVDVGAHIGSFTAWLHSHRPLREGFCFEPDDESFALCKENLRANGVNNVTLSREALGGRT